MPAVRLLTATRGTLYRIGRWPDPLAWPLWRYVGDGRFDDPQRQFRTLYFAAQRRTAFIETLAPLRLPLDLLADHVSPPDQRAQRLGGRISVPWRSARAVGQARLGPGQRWLDLRALATREALRQELAPLLLQLGFRDLDLSSIVGPQRALTQAIARWAHEQGAMGLVYHSRLDNRRTCWAVFEGATFTPAGAPERITADDPDLAAVARLFGLYIDVEGTPA